MMNKRYMFYSILGIVILALAQTSLWGVRYLMIQEEDPGVVIPEGIGKVENGLEYINLEAIESSQYMSFENLIKEEPQNLIIITNDQGEREYYVSDSLINGWSPNKRTPSGTLIESSKEVFIPAIDENFVIDENIVDAPFVQQQNQPINAEIEDPGLNQPINPNVPIEEDGIRYKIIQPEEAGVHLGNKGRIINGQEAFSLAEKDPILNQSFEEILSEEPLHLAVLTVTNNPVNPNSRLFREYYTLEALENWETQHNARRGIYIDDEANFLKGSLISPVTRQLVKDIKVFIIENSNAAPASQPSVINPAHGHPLQHNLF